MSLIYSTASHTWTIAEDTQACAILDNEISVSDPGDYWIHQQLVDGNDELYAEVLGFKGIPTTIYFYDVNSCQDVPALLNSLPCTVVSVAFA